MRLSHWDFRPKKRRKYVAAGSVEDRSAPPRKRLTLRILLLVAFGVLVYLKYEDFIRSPVAQSLRHPEALWQKAVARIKAPTGPQSASFQASIVSDSASMRLVCASPSQDSCLDAWTALESGERGRLRALLWKARIHGMMPESAFFSATFHRNTGATPDSVAAAPDPLEPDYAGSGSWMLEQVKLTETGRSLTLAAAAGGIGAEILCSREEGSPAGSPPLCLDEPGPRAPLNLAIPPRLVQERPPVIAFLSGAKEPFHSVLPGKVIDVPSATGGWLKVHHGGTLFSYYSGFAGLREGLHSGSLVGAGDTLGFAGGTGPAVAAGPGLPMDVPIALALDGALAGLMLRIEKNGTAVDPMAFLGLDADTGKVAHGP